MFKSLCQNEYFYVAKYRNRNFILFSVGSKKQFICILKITFLRIPLPLTRVVLFRAKYDFFTAFPTTEICFLFKNQLMLPKYVKPKIFKTMILFQICPQF